MRRKMSMLVAVLLLPASAGVSLAQYKGPPIIIQTPQPQPQPPISADGLKPTLQAVPSAPPAAAPPAAAAPAAAAPARPCAANTTC